MFYVFDSEDKIVINVLIFCDEAVSTPPEISELFEIVCSDLDDFSVGKMKLSRIAQIARYWSGRRVSFGGDFQLNFYV